MTQDQVCLIALGSNLPCDGRPPEQTLRAAVRDLAAAGAEIIAVSRFFQTPCFPAGAGPDYVNAALAMRWGGDPATVLQLLHQIEARHARVRETRWAGRTLDLDLIAFGQQVLPDAQTQTRWRDLPLKEQMRAAPDQLVLPHPRLQDRPFVLIPLNDVAPDWRHPLLGGSIAEFCADLPLQAQKEVVPLPMPDP